jgi:hypothetical protein
MITPSKLEKGITLLQTHFNRELCPQAIAIWSEYLNEHLDDETFTLAVKEAIIGLDFFPNAKKLVEFATVTKEVAAIAQWQIVLAAAKTANEQWRQEILQQLKDQAHTALAAIGGIDAVAWADEWQLNKLNKEFTTVYCQSHSQMKLLPPARVGQPHFQVLEEDISSEAINLETKSPSIRRVLENLHLRSIGTEIPLEQVYKNTFARYGWDIDERRLNFFVAMDEEIKKQFLARFQFAMKSKSSWHSLQAIFDDISGYQSPRPTVDVKAIARQWLNEESQSQSQAQEIEF